MTAAPGAWTAMVTAATVATGARATAARVGRLARSGPTTLAVSLSILALTGPVGAAEADPPAASRLAEARAFDIPAASLDEALARFGRQAGTAITVNAELTTGRRSDGVSGQFTPAAALVRLLAGTGLEAVDDGAGGFSLRRLPPPAPGAGRGDATTTLATVRVQASTLRDPVTEHQASYRARSTNTAVRLDLSPRETPQTVHVITRQAMDDFAMTSVNEAVETVSGAYVYEEASNGTRFYSRGFMMEAQYDGLPNPVGIGSSNRNPRIDNAFYDRIEVLMGPAGLLSGAGDPGGVINLVRKRPTAAFQGRAEVLVGSWQQRRAVVDLSTPLVESGRIRGRVVGLVDNANGPLDYSLRYRRGLYAIVEADLTPTTQVHASYQYQRDRQRQHIGVPFASDGRDLHLDPGLFFGNPRGMAFKGYDLQTVGVEQRLGRDWTVKANYTHGRTELRNYRDSWLWGDLDEATGEGIDLYQAVSLLRLSRFEAVDLSASGEVGLFGRRHEVVVGFNGSRMRDAHEGSGFEPTPINVYHFDPATLPEPVPGNAYDGDDRTRQHGLFGVARLNLADSLKLILGSRVSWYRVRTGEGEEKQSESGVVTPYAGVVYDLSRQYSVYASYADIFKPQSERDLSGRPIDPVVGSNLEVGLKGEVFDGRVNLSAALFRLEQTNLARADESIAPDPTNACAGQCYEAADKVRSRGIDLGLSGEPLPGWSLSAGYTFTDSAYASGEDKGERYMSSLPRHSFRLSSFYHFGDSRWGAGASLRYFGRTYNQGEDYRIERGPLTLVGLTARYAFTRQTDLTFTIDNLLDRRYYASVDSLFYTPLGEPRRLSAMVRHRF